MRTFVSILVATLALAACPVSAAEATTLEIACPAPGDRCDITFVPRFTYTSANGRALIFFQADGVALVQSTVEALGWSPTSFNYAEIPTTANERFAAQAFSIALAAHLTGRRVTVRVVQAHGTNMVINYIFLPDE